MSEIKVNKISPATSTDITLGDSGDTFTVPSGATIVNSGTATGFGGGVAPYFFATKTSSQTSISQNTWTKVTWDVETFDSDSAFDLANDKFVVPSGKAGKYVFTFSVGFSSWGGGNATHDQYSVRLYKNGAAENQVKFHVAPAINTTGATGTFMADLSVADYIELYAYSEQGSGTGSFDGDATNPRTHWGGFYIGT